MDNSVRIKEIQNTLKNSLIDGWLFYNFHGIDPFASKVLLFNEKALCTRRWFYFLPASGEPVRIVHRVEKEMLDGLPGKKWPYHCWEELHRHLESALKGCRKVAMQYSPMNAIPYISVVDGGTLELIRSFGVEVVTSADLIQRFESVLTAHQIESHIYAVNVLRKIVDQTFQKIAGAIRNREVITEFSIQQFMLCLMKKHSLIASHGLPIVAVNAHASDPHFEVQQENSTEIRQNDLVLLDLWAKRDEPSAVFGDITWMGYCGSEVPERYEKVYQIAREARDSAITFIREGLKEKRAVHGWEVDREARKIIENAGYGQYFVHRTGHSIGEMCHGLGVNIDSLETKDERCLIDNICFSIEPGIYLEGDFGVRTEIDVVIRESEALIYGEPIQQSIVKIL